MIIANHSLVMADADLGGGVILPAPEETIYVFDEAHHLPTVAREHASAAATLKGAASWLEKLNQSLSKFTALGDEKRAERFAEEARTAIQYLIPTLNQLPKQFMAEQFVEGIYRFEHGELPQWLADESQALSKSSQKAMQSVSKVADLIAEKVKEGELATRIAEPALGELGFYVQRLENLTQVWQLMAKPNKDKGPL